MSAFFAISSTSHTSLRNHENHCRFTSGIPPVLELTTGTCAAIASKAARPKLSFSEGRRNKSQALRSFSGFVMLHRKCMCSTRSISFAIFSKVLCSGPSPTSMSFAGIFFCTMANILMISSILFTSLKLDVCTKIRSPLGAYFCLISAHSGTLYSSRLTKFGMTCMSLVVSKYLYVSCLRLSDTAVMAVDWLIENDMIGSNDSSLPTKVMSVPWSVVINGRSMPLVLRICCAMYAADA